MNLGCPHIVLFYILNSEGIYSITIGLKLLGKGTVFEKDLNRLAELAYSQLSDNAREMVDQQAEKKGLSITPQKPEFINAYEILNNPEITFTYFLKEPIEFNIQYKCNGKIETAVGTMRLHMEGTDRFSKVIIKTESGEVEVNIYQIMDLKRVDQDLYFDRIRYEEGDMLL